MKQNLRVLSSGIAMLLLLGICLATALAATETGNAVSITEQVYPAEVRVSEEDGVYRLEKVYYLIGQDDPAAISTANFEREGRTYTLTDILKK